SRDETAVLAEDIDAVTHLRAIGEEGVRVVEQLAAVNQSVVVADGGRPVDVVPNRLKVAVAVEDLDTAVLAVGDVDVVVIVDADVMRALEVAGLDAVRAPRDDELAVRREAVDRVVAVAVGDDDVASLTRDGEMGRQVEGLAAPLWRRLTHAAERPHQLA